MANETMKNQPNFGYRYGVIVLAIVVVSQLGIQETSVKALAVSTYQNLANIASLNATVPPNEYNTLAMQFDQKDKELTLRETQLIDREKELDAKYLEEIAATKRFTFYSVGGITLLLIFFIFLNFYFDIKREEERERLLLKTKEGAQILGS